MHNVKIITVDGPGSSGKGTLAAMLATALGWNLLDSGLMYRALALYLKMQNKLHSPASELQQLAKELPINFIGSNIMLESINITSSVRSEEIGGLASQIAVIPEVRLGLYAKQRDSIKPPGLVADGRDMGTVIFPEANLKFYLDASAKVRAQRRYSQLKTMGKNVNLENLIFEIEQRDFRDQTRDIAPLLPAKDAIVLDSSNMTIKQVLAWVLEKVKPIL